MPGVTGFVPEGLIGIYGNTAWSFDVSGNALAPAVSSKTQKGRIRVDHKVWVYFADAKTPPSYYVLHHMVLSADPTTGGMPLANKNDARGYFNSSALVHYFGPPTVSPGCSITKENQTPRNGDDQFDTIIDGPEMAIIGKTSGGTGKVLFKPQYQVRNHIEKWSLRDSGEPSWELYQREVWNAAGVDGPVDGQFNVKVPDEWVDDFFDGAFGKIKEMPKSSFAPLTCEMFVVWRIDRDYGLTPFTKDSRDVQMILPLEHMQRLTLFHNGNLGADHEPRRLCGLVGGAQSKTLELHKIATPHDK
jgi:hypothetical protein